MREQPTTEGSRITDKRLAELVMIADRSCFTASGTMEVAEALRELQRLRSPGGASGCAHVPAGYSCVTPGCSNGPAPEPSAERVCRSPVARTPILYNDTVQGKEVHRDDLWAVTTAELNALEDRRAPEPVAKPHGVNKADGCPVCFVPWGACQHTNPPRERT